MKQKRVKLKHNLINNIHRTGVELIHRTGKGTK